MTGLTVMIPVFNALDEVQECLASLMASDARDAAILLLDDGSGDEVRDALVARAAANANIRVLSHFRNRGYTRNINMGLAEVATPYVTILNSDTLVPQAWSGRAVALLKADLSLAGVGPLSNAASYQSVPEMIGKDGKFTANGGFGAAAGTRERINELLGAMFAGVTVDAPILNGFCTTFRTAALREAGGFDEKRFPRGYGEENDICLRLLAQGNRLAVDPSTFVFHRKSMSFGAAQKAHLSALGNKELGKLYGERTMAAFAAMLREQPVLDLARNLTRRYFTASASPSMPDAIDRLLALPPRGDNIRVRMISGPAQLRISGNGCKVNAGDGIDALTVSSPQPHALSVNLPAGMCLPLVEGDWLWSACFSLAVASYARPVTVDESYGNAAAFIAAEVPVADMPFRSIYLT